MLDVRLDHREPARVINKRRRIPLADCPPAHEPKKRDRITLSREQQKVLRYVVAGKGIRDISDLTGMSYRTIRFHLEEARKRYGHTNTHQTVFRAALDYAYDPPTPA